jgi:hypothetical protein
VLHVARWLASLPDALRKEGEECRLGRKVINTGDIHLPANVASRCHEYGNQVLLVRFDRVLGNSSLCGELFNGVNRLVPANLHKGGGK